MSPHRYASILGPLLDRQPACGATRVVAVDGPSGSGKTSLATDIARAAGGDLLHLEDLYPGWNGLEATPPLVRAVLESLAVGDVGRAPRWDWEHDRPGGTLLVPPVALLVLDGVGSGAAVLRPFLSLLVWVDSPTEVRKERALARDGEAYAPYWDVWAAQEARHFSRQSTQAHADLVVRT